MSTPAPARRMTAERRREHLIAAALLLYGRLPPEQVGVDDITRAADVSRALFYRYFSGPAELHVAALGSVAQEMITRVTMPTDLPPAEQLRGALDAFLAVAQAHAPAYVALLRSGSVISTGETAAIVDGVRDHIVALVIDRADPAAGSDASARHGLRLMAVRGWVSLVEGACLSWLQDPVVPRALLLEWLAEQLKAMCGVGADAYHHR